MPDVTSATHPMPARGNIPTTAAPSLVTTTRAVPVDAAPDAAAHEMAAHATASAAAPLCALLHAFQLARRDGAPQDIQHDLLGALLERLYWPLYRFALARLQRFAGAKALAEEVVQDTLLGLARGAHRCRALEDAQLLAWALRSCRHELYDLIHRPGTGLTFRRREVELRLLTDGEDFESSVGRRPDLDAAFESLLALAVDVYDSMPAATAALFWLRLIFGAEWSEIAAELETTPSGAKRRFQRAQLRLRQALAQRVEALPPAEHALVQPLLRRLAAGRTRGRSRQPSRSPATRSDGR